MHPLIQRRCCSHSRGGSLALRTIAHQWIRPNSVSIALPLQLTRRNHNKASTSSTPSKRHPIIKKADAIVVGGGPAGIAAVGKLLETIPDGKIVWIDRSFEGGSLRLYREVPSYSSVDDFLNYARALETFNEICDAAPKPNAITALEGLPLGVTCMMHYAADMFKLLSDGLLKHKQVESIVGAVVRASRDPTSGLWAVGIQPEQIGFDQDDILHQAPIVVYCLGSRPETENLPPSDTGRLTRLSLETGLAPSRLAKLLPSDEPRTIAVIGDSHSAVLILRNLFRLAVVSHQRLRIRWFTPTANLKYADFTDDGVLLNENTGLKGEAARFARTQLEGDLLKRSDAGTFITRFILPTNNADRVQQAKDRDALYRANLDGVRYVFQAIGWARNRLPLTRPGLAGPAGKAKKMMFNSVTGTFFPRSEGPETVIGLFGAGSAFPEMELTAKGRQPAVGAWKFMQFLQKAVPRWVDAVKRGKINQQLEPPRQRIRFGGVERVVVGRRLERPIERVVSEGEQELERFVGGGKQEKKLDV